MAHGASVPNVQAESLEKLSRLLCDTWPDLTPPFQLFFAPGQHANKQTHMVAVDANSAHVGLKAARRVGQGSEREGLIARLARALDLPHAQEARMLEPMRGLGSLSGQRFLAMRWTDGAEALDKLPEATRALVAENAIEFLETYGEWLGFGLLFGVRDRNAGNWVCSPDGCVACLIDAEDSLGSEARSLEFRTGLEVIGLLARFRPNASRRAESREAIERGLRRLINKWRNSRAAVEAILSEYDWSATYRPRWMNLDEEAFVAEAIAGLS